MVSTSSGKLMRVDDHVASSIAALKAAANRSDSELDVQEGWQKSIAERKGACKVKGADYRCLKGAPSTCTGTCETVNSGTCNAVEMRYFFHFSMTTNQTKFCVPTAGCTAESCCQFTKCLEASGTSSGSEVMRRDCTTVGDAANRQKWQMPYARRRNQAYREIFLKGNNELCLKLYMHSPYTLSMRTCATAEQGYEKLWNMPFQPTTTTTTTTTTSLSTTTTTTAR